MAVLFWFIALECTLAVPPESESAPIPSVPQSQRQTNSMNAGWSFTDAVVLLFAAAVLVMSIVGFWWLLRN